MPIAVTEEHRQLAEVVRSLFQDRYPGAARAALDAGEAFPPFWKELADLGWLGLHLPEEHGGQGYGLEELAVVLDEMGYRCAPGPFLPTVVASAVIAAGGGAAGLLPGLADGSLVAGIGLWGDLHRGPDGTVHGGAGPVLAAGLADVLVLAVGDDLVVVDADVPGLSTGERPNIDLTRRSQPVTCTGVAVAAERTIPGGRARAGTVLRALAAAEAAGGARACVDMAASYAKERHAFGRPIGQFQAVKHHCANMYVAAEMAAAAAWDAARAGGSGPDAAWAAAVGGAVGLDAFVRCAILNIQVHGGIGYTWEHDAHIYLRRAVALASLAGPVSAARADVARLATGGVHRTLAIDLPPEAEALRAEVREFVARYRAMDPPARHQALLESGYLFPHWPRPWGRGAGAIEQIVVDEEFAGIDRTAALSVATWTLPIVLPTIMAHGTDEQKERWIRPTLEGRIVWCQLFSEPDAGSDLASLRTRAVRTEGGWLVSGSKVWTSTAQFATLGFALVRTDPDAPQHQGITCMAIDMKAEGMEVRPLRELTGGEAFNQEFLDNVFVPDANVVGQVNRGWTVARTTLGNERVSLGTDHRVDDLLSSVGVEDLEDRSVAIDLGALLAEAHTIAVVNLRQATRAVIGAEPGAEGNITKLVNAEHAQRAADLALRLQGPAGVFADGPAFRVIDTRALTIAGGTSEIVRNTIAERLLGLPRDPRPQ